MGDPHQSYLVARIPRRKKDGSVVGWTYICVAALYDNSCHQRALQCIRRFITLAKQPDNAEIIREEIRLIGESHWQLPKRIPSNYLARLLACAFSFGLEEDPPHCPARYLSCGIDDVSKPFLDPYNTEGASVIDITNPENCSYCLIPPPDSYYSEFKGERYVLLTAEEYAARIWEPELESEVDSEEDSDEERHGGWRGGRSHKIDQYSRRQEREREFQRRAREFAPVAAPLRGVSYMDPDILCEVWPHYFPRRIAFMNRQFSPRDEANSGALRKTSAPQPSPPRDMPIVTFPRLTELLFEPALKHVVHSGDIGALGELLILLNTIPTQEKIVLSILRSPNGLPSFPDAFIDNLVELLLNDWDRITLDLSYLPLTTALILGIAERLADVQVLKLSHNPLVTIDTVRSLLTNIRTLKRLVLLDTPITGGEWAALFEDHKHLFYNLEGLVHPRLVKMSKTFYPPALTFYRCGDIHASVATVPFFTNKLLFQALTLYMRKLSYKEWGINAVDGILSAEPLDSGLEWSQRTISFFSPPSDRPLKATGWIFLLVSSRPNPTSYYGFVKPEIQQPVSDGFAPTNTCTVYDIYDFLDELEKEGRPRFSDEEAEDLIDLFDEPEPEPRTVGRNQVRKHRGFELISNEEAHRFIFPPPKAST